MCKGPGAGRNLGCLRKSKKAEVAGSEQAEARTGQAHHIKQSVVNLKTMAFKVEDNMTSLPLQTAFVQGVCLPASWAGTITEARSGWIQAVLGGAAAGLRGEGSIVGRGGTIQG
jgi:hypothetical protein